VPVQRAKISELELELGLDEADDRETLRAKVAQRLGVAAEELPELAVQKRAIDARRGRVRFHLTISALDPDAPPLGGAPPREVDRNARVLIVGDGPSGLFCAYELARRGVGSVVLDRGKLVQPRRRDLKGLTRHGVVNEDSNYCFGEGGAGTYSDGKLYTRSHKRGDVRDVLELLAVHGAPPEILADARPHIGSNKLPKVISALRERLTAVGVRFRFEARVTGLVRRPDGRVSRVRLASGEELEADAVVLATGHSARDIYELLSESGVGLVAKGFALGVRIEHPQPLINQIQYGRFASHPRLPNAAYRLAHTEDERGVFSFCMCPGGFIVPAATEPDGVVVNGMSLSRRDSPFANSGLVVSIDADELGPAAAGPLAGVEFQRAIERAAFRAGGGRFRAPAQRLGDFLAGRPSDTVGPSSYRPGVVPGDLGAVLPRLVVEALRAGLRQIGGRLPAFLLPDALLIAAETRTSAPVRILRDPVTLVSPSVEGLYPCGEGAGYAGGIVSAALDGLRVADRIFASAGQ